MSVGILLNNLLLVEGLTKNDIKRLNKMKDDSRFDELKEVIEVS